MLELKLWFAQTSLFFPTNSKTFLFQPFLKGKQLVWSDTRFAVELQRKLVSFTSFFLLKY